MTSPRRSNAAPPPSALLPAAGVPLLYFGFAHACLALAFAILAVQPSLPAGFFLHPRMVALVHLVTLGWISGSILGAFYIVGPLALRMPLRPGWMDRAAFASFAAGIAAVVARAWSGEYEGMAGAALLVFASMLHVSLRAWRGLGSAVAPWPVKLHVALAFGNVLAASLLGMLIGVSRAGGWLPWSPMSAAYAHAHLAAIGWATMMVVGLSYRLIPMIVPATMPSRASLAVSAVLLQAGVTLLASTLLAGSPWSLPGALLILGGLVSFVVHVRLILRRRLPPPAALPRPDWATRQTHAALLWLLCSAGVGLVLSLPVTTAATVTLQWVYGTLGLIGFLSQIVVGIQGRLLPLHAWYGAFEAGGLQPPARSAHGLASQQLARLIVLTWLAGVPLLAFGLATATPAATAMASTLLFGGVVLNAIQAATVTTRARAALQPPGLREK